MVLSQKQKVYKWTGRRGPPLQVGRHTACRREIKGEAAKVVGVDQRQGHLFDAPPDDTTITCSCSKLCMFLQGKGGHLDKKKVFIL